MVILITLPSTCKKHNVKYIYIEDQYEIDIDLGE